MIRRSMALRIGAILSVLAALLSGCVSELEPSDVDVASVDEASEQLTAPSSGASSTSDDDDSSPSDRTPAPSAGGIGVDPLPWDEDTAPDFERRIRCVPGPDPLPWAPGGDSSAGSPGTGKKD